MGFLILSTALLSNALLSAQRAVIQIPESEEPVTISLSRPAKDVAGFATVTVRVHGHASVFRPKNPVACAPGKVSDRKNDLDWADIKGMTLDPSFCFHRAEYGKEMKHSVLAFMSRGGASDAGPAFILGFQTDGTPYKILERDELDLYSFEPSASDETASIVGLPSLSQVMAGGVDRGSKSPYATTYDPRAVYIVCSGAHAQYSLEASRAYNTQHYIWAGPRMSEDYAVVYNYPGRPKLFGTPANQVGSLFAKLQEKRP